VAERLGHSERSVRRIAAEILTKLGPEALAPMNDSLGV